VIIDAHHHVWDLRVREQDWITDDMAEIRRSFAVDDLRDIARAAGVAATVVVQTVPVAAETRELLAIAAADPLVAAVVGWTDLTATGVSDELARLRSAPGGRYLVGIRHQVQSEPDADWLRRPAVRRGLRAVAGAGLSYDLLVRPHQLAAAAHAAARVPELTFVLDHAGKPVIGADTSAWARDIRALAACPNTVCKLSGLVTEALAGATQRDFHVVGDVILSAFGPDRVMFGSDWPVCLLSSDYTGVVELARALLTGLSEAERTAVFATTAARVYGGCLPDLATADDQGSGGGSWRLPMRRSTR
jgi:L-fuconolactonase